MTGPEATQERRFERWCTNHGLHCLKLKPEGKRGFPDRTVIGPGFVAFVEWKAEGGRLSHHQLNWLQRLSDMGHPVLVVTKFSAAKDFILRLMACDCCGGIGCLDSGGVDPSGKPIDVPCPKCSGAL